MKLEIRGMIENSLLDWDGKVVSTLFVPRCNFRCPYCQNSGLVLYPEKYPVIPVSVIQEHLLKYRNWIDGICLTGGEPCLYEDIDLFLEEIKKLGMKIKLDTNGAFPEVIKKLFEKNLVDYIAMDIKSSFENSLDREKTKYEEAAGVKVDTNRIKESIRIIMESGIEYEFRTTVVPVLHTAEDITAIARYIKGARKYCLQNFSSREVMRAKFKKVVPYKLEELEEMRKLSLVFVKECIVRG